MPLSSLLTKTLLIPEKDAGGSRRRGDSKNNINICLFIYMPDILLKALYRLSYIILTTTISGSYCYYLYLKNEDTELRDVN